MGSQQAKPDQTTPEPTTGKRHRRWSRLTLALVAVVILVCCGVPLVWVAGPLIVGTFTADRGEGSPGAALLAFVSTFEDGPDATGVERLIVADRRRMIVASGVPIWRR